MMQTQSAQLSPSVSELPKQPTAPVATLAAEMVMKYGEDTDAATSELHDILKTQYKAFYKWKAARAMRQWCFEQIRSGRSMLRRQITSAPMGRQIKAIQGLDAESLSSLISFYDWPLMGGIKLGDATAMEIIAACEKYERDSRIYHARATFLRMVEAALPSPDAVVRDTISIEQINRFAAETGILGAD